MSLEPFFKVLRAAQASSLTEPMPRRVSNASLASSHVASSVQAGEDAGARGADEELTPSDFVRVFSDLSELESLDQLCQPVGQDVLAMVVLRHCVHNGIHLGC